MATRKPTNSKRPASPNDGGSQLSFAGFEPDPAPSSVPPTPTPTAATPLPAQPSPGQAARPSPPLIQPLDTTVRPCDPEDMPPLEGRLVVLVDSHSLIYQLYHALPPMNSPAGLPVSTVHGFVGDMLELVRRKSPDYVVCAFDLSDITFRNELYDQYKAHREGMPDELRQQIPLVRAAIDAMGIGIMECAGFEADDILATVSKQVDAAGGRCLIVTSDKDCRQLITDRVRLYNIRKDAEMGIEELFEDWGIRPDQVIDYQALVGDPVDNVPGIPLIGPKLAKQLLNQYDTLDAVLDNADSVSGAKRKENLKTGRDRALLSRDLVALRHDVPCSVPWSRSTFQLDVDRLDSMMEQFGFRRLRARLAEIAGSSSPKADSTEAASNATTPLASSMPAAELEWKSEYETITDVAALDDLVSRIAGVTELAIDTETTGTDARGCALVGISLAWKPESAAYIPIRSPAGEPSLDEATVIDRLRPLLENEQIKKVGHNLKFDVVVLRSAGVSLRSLGTDTMVADYLLHPGHRNHTLDDLSARYLGYHGVLIQQLIGSGKKQLTMDQVPLEQVARYACEDVDIPIRIAPLVQCQLTQSELGELYQQVEMPLVEVLAEMEFNGIRVDVDHLSAMSDLFATKIENLREEIYAAAGGELNLDSPKQLATLLFERLGLPVIRKTKTGASTDVDVLQSLAAIHPLPARIIDYRQATKLKNTYIDALPKLVNPTTGRVHTSFRQDVAATGRLSSTEPNLQNIPIRSEEGRAIRGAFRAGPDDWLLLAADYSQIELRVLAHYCGDAAMVDAYEHDRDIHTRVAAEVNAVDEASVTADMRRMAKTINFGIVYGQSPFGLAKTLGISKDEAAQYIEMYFARYPGVQEFMLATMESCRREGYVQTMLGRRRHVQGIRDLRNAEVSKRRNLTEAERIAVNTVIQGSAADLIKLAMISLHRRLSSSGLKAKL
ncbi:MAG: DNA polymerase I, partial [Planctomycetaceae bacterium]